MSDAIQLSAILFKDIPIPEAIAEDVYVERALQERRAAATALECINAHALCLDLNLDSMVGGDEAANETIKILKGLVKDIRNCATYDEVEMEHASAEI